ncbi:DUF6115 domain-containing protein [Scopulibacillus cellulosilyticus]|uniref:DUF6115 domain-containing protein n=1 Tax=Scopulibacillus cellulosilyticus TaxID=2665665 RepID=A0ABW2PTR8_9BACL
MIAAWLVISFICHLTAFYIIIHLWQRVVQMQKYHPETLKKDIEDTLTAYVIEMEEENNRLIKELQFLREKRADDQPIERENNYTLSNPSGKGEPPSLKEDTYQKPVITKRSDEETFPDHLPQLENIKDNYEETVAAKALKLMKKGYNVNDIAKELNKGKGEIELLLYFQKDKIN